MVTAAPGEVWYTAADEALLDSVLVGREPPHSAQWYLQGVRPRFPGGAVGVIWTRAVRQHGPIRPLVLVVPESAMVRLYGRYAQLRSDLSPLTAWCHVLSPELFESVQPTLTKFPDLGGLEAAWTGLVIAESVLLTGKPVSDVGLSVCLATQTYAVARAQSLWGRLSVDDVLARYDSARKLCRSDVVGKAEPAVHRVREAFRPIWETLFATSGAMSISSSYFVLSNALRALADARDRGEQNEAHLFAEPLMSLVPEATAFQGFGELTPEMRLRLFDRLVNALDHRESDGLQKHALTTVCGYLATVAAGGAPSMRLAEEVAGRWPEITAWAHVLGGVGERVVWTSSFDGLGRLVARELMRPLRLDESPACEFALDEGAVIVDPGLSDPLVHLRVRPGSRVVNLALWPGVNSLVPLPETVGVAEPNKSANPRSARQVDAGGTSQPTLSSLAPLADALWPHLRSRVTELLRSERSEDAGQGHRGRRGGAQQGLPLSPSKKER